MLTKFTTDPAVEPATVAEVKSMLNIEHDLKDTEISGLITNARQWIEAVTGRAYVQRNMSVSYKYWPSTKFVLPYPPVQSISSIKYTGADGTEYTLDTELYDTVLDKEPAEIVLGYNKVWPTTTLHHESYPITISCVTGYPETDDSPPDYTANIPEAIKYAIAIYVKVNFDDLPEKMEKTHLDRMESMIAPYRVWWA